MDRNDVRWSGYWSAAPTPFESDGAVDHKALKSLMRLYRDLDLDGVLINGSTGEWFSQSISERKAVARSAIESVARQFPVVVGITCYTASEAIDLARDAQKSGADGLLATPPPYVHPDADEIVEFYGEVSDSTDLPFMVYNWPRGVSVDMSTMPGLYDRLAELENIVAIKDSTGDWNSMLRTVELMSDKVRVFGSFLHRKGLAALLELGGDGNIDGGGVGAPFGVPFYKAVSRHDGEAARVWADKYQALSGNLINFDYSGVFASPIPQLKAVMNKLGQPGGFVRSPLLELTDPARLNRLDQVIRDSGILAATKEVLDGTR